METARNIISFIWDYLFFFNIPLAVMVVFLQRKEPRSVWTWLLILYFLPIIGFVLYILIGTDMHKQRIFRTKEIEDRLSSLIASQSLHIREETFDFGGNEARRCADLILYNLKTSGAVLSHNNDITVINDGKEKFDRLLADLETAAESIHIEYYIIRDDEVFAAICEVLGRKAQGGVEVRLLYDAMGCRHIRKRRWKALNEKGIKAVAFFPALLGWLHIRVNYRNHRKIVVVDNKVAYLGGFNVGREYLGMDEHYGYWRDLHLRIEGNAVFDLQTRFILDWNHASPQEENLFIEKFLGHVSIREEKGADLQIVTDGPDTAIKNIRDNYLRLISKARKCIYIQTPYYIPDEAIASALLIAIHSGIEVNVMIPCKPDHPFVYWATYSHIGELVMAGASCYTYEKGFMHAKALIVDEEVVCCGTANMDVRSFTLDFEVNATIYDAGVAGKMIDAFREDLPHCNRITKDDYLRRSLKVRFKEQTCRILSPLM